MTALTRLLQLHDSINIAEELSTEQLTRIGSDVVRNTERDEQSRAAWMATIEKALEIAKQVVTKKAYPWEGAANVKFPLIAKASINFAAHTYPELIRNSRVVGAYVAGEDPDGSRAAHAQRISDYMSYQLLVESDTWEEGTDRLLHILAVVGTVFRKTYYDPIRRRPCFDLCSPDSIIINNSAPSLGQARRVTHVLEMSRNDIVSRMNAGLFCEVPLEELEDPTSDDSDPQLILQEQHAYLDLDEDGYDEPYVITVFKRTQRVVRIVARWDMNKVEVSPKGKVIHIEPVQYFTDFHFLPSPDNSFYSMGFGTLLYPINESINTTINQLLDAGTLSNLQSGFISNTLRIAGGDVRFKPGEWKKADSMGAAMHDAILPLPTKDPSAVLMNLLSLLIETGQDLAAINDVLTGQQPAQNVPATTILALVENGLKVFNSIERRLFRAFKKEFEKLYRLNSLYLDDKRYFAILNNPQAIGKKDFQLPDFEVRPISDPGMSSAAQRLARAQALMQMLGQPNVNVWEIQHQYLTELQTPNIDKILPPPQPPKPDPEALKVQAEMEAIKLKGHKDMLEGILKNRELDLLEKKINMHGVTSMAKIEKLKADALLDIARADQLTDDSHLNRYIQLIGLIQDGQLKLEAAKELQQEIQKDRGARPPASGVTEMPSVEANHQESQSNVPDRRSSEAMEEGPSNGEGDSPSLQN